MSRVYKEWILNMLREANCIETPILNKNFKSVWIGEDLKGRIEIAKEKRNSLHIKNKQHGRHKLCNKKERS